LRPLASLTSGPEDVSIWNKVWSGDRYADPLLRDRRARRRLASFGLLNSSLPAGTRVLDAGCGSGETLHVLSSAQDTDIEFVGSDFSERAVSLSRGRLAERANILQAPVTDLPFPNAHFSHVLLFGVIEHVQDVSQALTEIRRVSRPGAMIYFSTSNYFSTLQGVNFVRRNTYGYPYGYQKNWKRKELENQLTKFFKITHVDYVHTDRDMPIVKSADEIVAFIFTGWARYMHITCELGR
jgi:ubiquinone/menaquinone biosynthesis C-methylase UbiE